MSRLEHLLKLAQKTGDTLIIHNEKERDMVIMDVTMYEVLHDMCGVRGDMEHHGCDDCDCGHDDVAMMSEREMLDKINRDIADWRAYQDEDEQWDRAMSLEDDLMTSPRFDPFEEDLVHEPSWHRAGDVLQDRTSGFDIPFNVDDDEGISFDEEPVDFLKSEETNVDEPEYDDLGEVSIGKFSKTDIPFFSHDDFDDDEELIDEEDDDEPMFFEEPV